MQIISGKAIAQSIKEDLKNEVDKLAEQNITPCLAVILVGDDPASAVYVNSKKKACEKLGILSIEKRLPHITTQEELIAVVKEYNEDPSIHGILCQVPLPPHCNEQEIIELIDPIKDVDCFHPYNVGLLATGSPRYMPCTPFGVCQILKKSGIETQGKSIVILGRSNIVGRPLSILLSLKGWDATVTVCHSLTRKREKICSEADILISAIGRSEMVTKEFVKPGAVVIDVGTNHVEDENHPKGHRLTGDVNLKDIEDKASMATPVPGGVGPMTITMLMLNTINAARLQAGLPILEL